MCHKIIPFHNADKSRVPEVEKIIWFQRRILLRTRFGEAKQQCHSLFACRHVFQLPTLIEDLLRFVIGGRQGAPPAGIPLYYLDALSVRQHRNLAGTKRSHFNQMLGRLIKMARQRGNPNWGKQDQSGPIVVAPSSFELIVKEFDLTPEQYLSSVRLREWAQRN